MRRFAVLLAIAACGKEPSPKVRAELERRSAYVHALAIREGMEAAWGLNSRDNLSYESGSSNVQFIDPKMSDVRWYDFWPSPSGGRGLPVRWMNKSVHMRVRGDGPMRLELAGTIAINQVFTKPRLEVSLDGALLASQVVDGEGKFSVALTVRDVADWSDLYLTWTALQDPEKEAGDPRFARLEHVRWEPAH